MSKTKTQLFLYQTLLFLTCIFLVFSLVLTAQEKDQEKKEKPRIIIEEIVVEAELPREFPISTTSSIKREKIESLNSRDLSEVLSYATGTYVSLGGKNEFRIKIRGFENQRIVLLYDGIPIYEPFFNSFDLRTITTEEVENIKIIKGASSVLYGPNALGGVINVITRRPSPSSFSLKTFYDSNNSFNIASSGAVQWKDILISGFATREKSDGFKWNSQGNSVLRENSDYERNSFTGKVYFYPNQNSEFLFEASHYSYNYGIPYATEYFKPRYWRFKDWRRFQINFGGTFTFLKKGNFKVRSYYVGHDNILDAYTDAGMDEVKWESTYNNDSYGVFCLGAYPYSQKYELKLLLNFRNDQVRTQDDTDKDWEGFEHRTISLGLENHFKLNKKWSLIGGISVDHLKKFSGENRTSLNPIAGIKFNPSDYADFHLTFSQKSRFPSMKALYSSTTGNPDLMHERGTSYEFGLSYERAITVSGALFYTQIDDLIQAVRRSDGSSTNLNIGKSNIFGFEFELQKTFQRFQLTLNYTYLDGKNEEENRPLDLLPKSQMNFVFDVSLSKDSQFTLWGLAVSGSEEKIQGEIVRIPGYFVLNTNLSKSFRGFMIFLKGENLLNKYYVTEPGYPMKARTFSVGLKFHFDRRDM